ncbi:glutathione S-transferase family protein [Klebsiella pneumoniae]|uniref:glutathione S-transferase family protein n=1 Tax=Klebsiella pneumoniae TaxID=573 RepID=UPI003F81E475
MITLWGRNNSTNVKKVRWVLEELDLPYQQILAGLEFGLNHDPEYLAMNPNGLVPDELAKTPWLSGEQFGLGDIAVAPFVYNLLSILDSWQPRPHLQRWYQQISQRPAWREVVQIPVT